MYAGVPATVPEAVMLAAAGARLDDAVVNSSTVNRARPKSATRARPSAPTRTFSGLKSRWIMASRRPTRVMGHPSRSGG